MLAASTHWVAPLLYGGRPAVMDADKLAAARASEFFYLLLH
jgi:hypothetical protein